MLIKLQLHLGASVYVSISSGNNKNASNEMKYITDAEKYE